MSAKKTKTKEKTVKQTKKTTKLDPEKKKAFFKIQSRD